MRPGNARRSWATLALACASMLIVAACGSSTGNPSQLKQVPHPTVQSILTSAQAAHFKDAEYTVTLTISGSSGGQNVSVTGTGNGKATSNPQRSDVTINVSVAGVSLNEEVITDGSNVYTKTTGATKWTKTTATSTDPTSSLTNPTSLFGPSSLQGASLVGVETVNGVSSYHLHGTVPASTLGSAAGSGTGDLTSDVWFRTDNYYPVKLVITSTGSTSGSSAGTYSVSIIINFTSWDTGVTIQVPPASQVQ